MSSSETVLLAALYLSFFGIATWRSRSNEFLFFAGIGVLVISSLLYLTGLVSVLKASR
jgi:hypothetical protein